MTIIRVGALSVVLSLLILGSGYAQTVQVTGVIRDPAGRPVASASVSVKNSRRGTSTDSLGVFHLPARPGDWLVITAVGFADTTLAAGSGNLPVIVLVPRSGALGEAVVSGSGQRAGPPSPEEAVREEIITSTFQDYLRGAMYSNGAYVTSSYTPGSGGAGGMVMTRTPGFGPLNTINSGNMLPVVTHQEDTRGSRYLLPNFVHGVVVDREGHVLTDSLSLFNYDKIDGQLLIAQNPGKYLEVDKEKVLAFALKAADTSFIFLNVPVLSKVSYFLLIARGPKYSAYKSIRTKFVKSNYQSNGLVETGNNYDEYVDKQTYFWVINGDSAGVFELKKKSIREAFAGEKAKLDAWFAAHRNDDIDDGFVRDLIDYLNKP
jgi:hypothetical protein